MTELIGDEVTKLRKDKSEFENYLKERVQIAKDLKEQNKASIENFKRVENDFEAWDSSNDEYLKQAFNKVENEYRSSYSMSKKSFWLEFPKETIERREWLVLDKKLDKKINKLNSIIAKIEFMNIEVELKDVEEAASKAVPLRSKQIENKDVFIVHGHDDLALNEIQLYVRELSLNPIVLKNEAGSSETVIEKIEKLSSVMYAIVLYTPCDFGGNNKKADEKRNRARQNVVFENGFLIGRLGRKNVSHVIKGDIEIPGDLNGIVYIKMQNDWKIQLYRELKMAGVEAIL
jgi:predicted nucleotide-binding protein